MSPSLAWLLLIISGITDVAWALATKKSAGFTEPLWAVASLLLLVIFIALLTKALTVLPLGTAYAVWTGIGAVGSLAAGVVLFGESTDPVRLTFAAVTILGVVGLKVSS
ncbi:multidrug efflux SMR transporter [Mesorhizobium sp. BH1-1-5]|uniref:DMT family transporter n=1 Tax=Mesorhizobium sp. BH1-1-5 TaxID=2876661 RepID=UPI001CCEF3B7|nr:multidrug efflux SMR transporter [Mesorhizobium sp. BH1-1-5]MBZ9989719.1 multidrug efflux SMR transporter [Mesorhizobium sp. BH1-1-5]